MNREDAAKEWFEIAKKDFGAAKFLKEMHPIPLEIICYHCQQSAEKMLKGYLAYQGEEIYKTHDLILLNNKCKKYDQNFANIEDECLRLTDYAVNIRYPYHLELTVEDMKFALKDADKVLKFIQKKFDLLLTDLNAEE